MYRVTLLINTDLPEASNQGKQETYIFSPYLQGNTVSVPQHSRKTSTDDDVEYFKSVPYTHCNSD